MHMHKHNNYYFCKMLKFDLFVIVAVQFLFISTNSANGIYSKFHQSDYKVEFQRLELANYEKSMCNWVDIKTYKFNRTFPVFNISFNFKKDMGPNLEVVVQLYKFLSNEYRSFPIRFEVNFCKSLNENLIGCGIAYKCGNFSTCYARKNTSYKICNGFLDESRLPPLIPNGEYKARCEFLDLDGGNQNVFTMDYYLKIYRPITSKNKNG